MTERERRIAEREAREYQRYSDWWAALSGLRSVANSSERSVLEYVFAQLGMHAREIAALLRDPEPGDYGLSCGCRMENGITVYPCFKHYQSGRYVGSADPELGKGRYGEGERAKAWNTVWNLCMSLGMQDTAKTGLGNVLHFIQSLAAAEPGKGEPKRWPREVSADDAPKWLNAEEARAWASGFNSAIDAMFDAPKPREAEGEPEAWKIIRPCGHSWVLDFEPHPDSLVRKYHRDYAIVPLYRAPEPAQPEPKRIVRNETTEAGRRAWANVDRAAARAPEKFQREPVQPEPDGPVGAGGLGPEVMDWPMGQAGLPPDYEPVQPDLCDDHSQVHPCAECERLAQNFEEMMQTQPEQDGELRERIGRCRDCGELVPMSEVDGIGSHVGVGRDLRTGEPTPEQCGPVDEIPELSELPALRARVEELRNHLDLAISDSVNLTEALRQREREVLELRARVKELDRGCDMIECPYERRAETAEREVERLESYEAAYNDISSRLDEAQAYASRHIGGRALGRNVWHALLDDAIQLRAIVKEMEPNGEDPTPWARVQFLIDWMYARGIISRAGFTFPDGLTWLPLRQEEK